MDRPNVSLACEEIPPSISRKDFSYFASRVADILDSNDCAIVYTDFIDDVGLIVNELKSGGVETSMLWLQQVLLEWGLITLTFDVPEL